jgi:hypothetical protein
MVEKGKIDWMLVVLLKEWKWVRMVLGAWNLREISQDLLGFVTQFFIDVGVELRSWQANASCS